MKKNISNKTQLRVHIRAFIHRISFIINLQYQRIQKKWQTIKGFAYSLLLYSGNNNDNKS